MGWYGTESGSVVKLKREEENPEFAFETVVVTLMILDEQGCGSGMSCPSDVSLKGANTLSPLKSCCHSCVNGKVDEGVISFNKVVGVEVCGIFEVRILRSLKM